MDKRIGGIKVNNNTWDYFKLMMKEWLTSEKEYNASIYSKKGRTK